MTRDHNMTKKSGNKNKLNRMRKEKKNAHANDIMAHEKLFVLLFVKFVKRALYDVLCPIDVKKKQQQQRKKSLLRLLLTNAENYSQTFKHIHYWRECLHPNCLHLFTRMNSMGFSIGTGAVIASTRTNSILKRQRKCIFSQILTICESKISSQWMLSIRSCTFRMDCVRIWCRRFDQWNHLLNLRWADALPIKIITNMKH